MKKITPEKATLRIIGLTGGIGSGKSTVARLLSEMGAAVIDTDKVGHRLLGDAGIQRQLISIFGNDISTGGSSIDRKKLAQIVFPNPVLRKNLEDILHPAILAAVKGQIGELEKGGTKVVVLEVPLLIEAGWLPHVDEVWVTTAPRSTILKRLEEDKGMPEEEALARINAQLAAEDRAKHADVIIDTDCSLEELKARVSRLWQQLRR